MTLPATAKPPPHVRLSFTGIFGTVLAPVEEWSFRLTLRPGLQPFPVEPATIDACRQAYVTHLTPRIKNVARLTQVKLASVGADGLYVGQAQVLDVDIPGTGAGTVNYPLSTSLACTLLTATRGPRGRGRIFLPAPELVTLSTSGNMTAGAAQGFATSVGAFLNAINANAGLERVVIASKSGNLRDVTGVKVGVVPDVIRSRREKVSEAYGADVAVTNA